MANQSGIKPLNPQLQWLIDMLALFEQREIQVPTEFRSQALVVERLLRSDASGLINSLLDFAISASMVDFSVETSNKTLSNTFNDWMDNINSPLRGQIPTGINALAEQYFRERWKGSSLLVLRSRWEQKDGFKLPTILWFVDGKDVLIKDDDETKQIGTEKYFLKVTNDDKKKKLKNDISLTNTKDHRIFVQKPFTRWGTTYPTPFLVERGVYRNGTLLDLLSKKGESIIARALEYLMLLKKGDVELAKLNKPEFIYSEDDLKAAKENLEKVIADKKTKPGVPSYVTNFDTQIDHLIPEYERAIKSTLFSPIERRILAGLGFIEIVEGITSTRKDAVINPRVFISEVRRGIEDFKMLMTDVLMTIIEENRKLRPKLTNSSMIQIRTSPPKIFFSDKTKDFMRSLYDRGLLSKRTLVELGADIDFDSEIERRRQEETDNLDEDMYPPIVQNVEKDPNDIDGELDPDDEDNPEEKKGPEKRNFVKSKYDYLLSKKKYKNKKDREKAFDASYPHTFFLETNPAGKNNHVHKVTVTVWVNEDSGEVTKIKGLTDTQEGHKHSVEELNKTSKDNKHIHTIVLDLPEVFRQFEQSLRDNKDKKK